MRATFTETAQTVVPAAATSQRPRHVQHASFHAGRLSRGAIVHLDASDIERLGAQVILANTYHSMLRPGADIVETLGGIHGDGRLGWPHGTDSGGYQIFSLGPEISDEGHIQVDLRRLNPTVDTGEGGQLKARLDRADIQMVLDVCPSSVADLAVVEVRSSPSRRVERREAEAALLDHPNAAAGRQSRFRKIAARWLPTNVDCGSGPPDRDRRHPASTAPMQSGGPRQSGEDREARVLHGPRRLHAGGSSRSTSPATSWDSVTRSASSSRWHAVSTCSTVCRTRLAPHGRHPHRRRALQLTTSRVRSVQPNPLDRRRGPRALPPAGPRYLRHPLLAKEPDRTSDHPASCTTSVRCCGSPDQMADAIRTGTFADFTRVGVHEVAGPVACARRSASRAVELVRPVRETQLRA